MDNQKDVHESVSSKNVRFANASCEDKQKDLHEDSQKDNRENNLYLIGGDVHEDNRHDIHTDNQSKIPKNSFEDMPEVNNDEFKTTID